jgi:hypothetical protein
VLFTITEWLASAVEYMYGCSPEECTVEEKRKRKVSKAELRTSNSVTLFI